MIKLILALLFIFISCQNPKEQTSKKSFIKRGPLKVARYLQKPHEIKKDDWVDTLKRTIFKNQTTGFIFTGEICKLQGLAFAILPIQIDHPSARDYATGIYYDALKPLTAENCGRTDYAFFETSESFKLENIEISIDKLKKSSLKPKLNLFIPIEPYAYSLGLNRGTYKKEDESLALQAHREALKHRVRPIKSWLEPYNEKRHDRFETYVSKNGITQTNIPINGEIDKLLSKNILKNPWFYVWDEPFGDEFVALKKSLTDLKKRHPSVSTMVTTSYNSDLEIDIYCPVAEHIDEQSSKEIIDAGSELWMYISCMSHGCGPSREYTSSPQYPNPGLIHDKTGTPDLSIEADAQDIYMFYLLSLRYPITGLLYYNSIEQWKLSRFGVNPLLDTYNFGGNGDGNLLYPNFKIRSPILSLRMKMIREASFLYDAIILGHSKRQFKNEIESTTNWSFDFEKIQPAYEKLK